MTIPEARRDRFGQFTTCYFERLKPDHIQTVEIGTQSIKLIYESPREGFTYGCTPPDVMKMLDSSVEHIPIFPDIIALRQPTRKQRSMEPVWGRCLYFAEFGICEGSAIILESQDMSGLQRYPKRMSLQDGAELERLRNDGHRVTETRRYFEAGFEPSAVRNTVLYRTLLHELGHWDQYCREVLDPTSRLAGSEEAAWELYCSKPASEKEVYAHKFAEALAQKLRASGTIPFDPQPFVANSNGPS
ncbi:hypothetical protein [Roseibium salinum]|uniref:Uncharacterized protein n=1 Tax=Roseibium salinum TaxID=1604349 RepID=A0ABT3QZQ8_9HYPH|nr:hypothetical protein [Roseibium sp. DSM 29163]MCX2722433.1 hypothetical protein [Roseibium sp. DSM 29163]MDN3719594.1 hypothetical protein [Roseibium salinum]